MPEYEHHGFVGATGLSGKLKGWTLYGTLTGRAYIFDPDGVMMLWGIDAQQTTGDAAEYAKFLADLKSPCLVRKNQDNYFVRNCRVVFPQTEVNWIMSHYFEPAKYGWSPTRFVRVALPGCKDESDLIAGAVLGLLAAAPLVDIDHVITRLAMLHRWVYSLPPEVRKSPANFFTPGLWLEFDKSLEELNAEPAKTRAGVRIPQTLTRNQIAALVDLLERAIDELPDGMNKNTYTAALNILLGHR